MKLQLLNIKKTHFLTAKLQVIMKIFSKVNTTNILAMVMKIFSEVNTTNIFVMVMNLPYPTSEGHWSVTIVIIVIGIKFDDKSIILKSFFKSFF